MLINYEIEFTSTDTLIASISFTYEKPSFNLPSYKGSDKHYGYTFKKWQVSQGSLKNVSGTVNTLTSISLHSFVDGGTKVVLSPVMEGNKNNYSNDISVYTSSGGTAIIDMTSYGSGKLSNTVRIPSSHASVCFIGKAGAIYTDFSISVDSRSKPLLIQLKNMQFEAPINKSGIFANGNYSIELECTGINSIKGGVAEDVLPILLQPDYDGFDAVLAGDITFSGSGDLSLFGGDGLNAKGICVIMVLYKDYIRQHCWGFQYDFCKTYVGNSGAL